MSRTASQPDFFSQAVRNARRFFLDLSPPVNAPLAVVCGGYEECEPHYAVKHAGFPYYSVELVSRGAGRLVLAGQEYQFTPGSVFAYGPGVAHAITTDPRDRLAKFFVDFSGGEAPQLFGPNTLRARAVRAGFTAGRSAADVQ